MGERVVREVCNTRQLQDRAAKSKSRSPKKRVMLRSPNNDEAADNCVSLGMKGARRDFGS
jgi:hypothetical protein